jgi:hypothetical protein
MGPWYTYQSTIDLDCQTSSGLAVSYTKVSGPFLLSGSQVTLLGVPGTCRIRADQAGNEYYRPAPSKLLIIDVIMSTDNETLQIDKVMKIWSYNNVLTIENAEGQMVEVLSMLGKTVLSNRIESDYLELPLNGLTPGLYLAKVGDEIVKIVVK